MMMEAEMKATKHQYEELMMRESWVNEDCQCNNKVLKA
jgi:hypothetical protein